MADLKADLKLQIPVDQIQNAYYAFYFRGFVFTVISFFVIRSMLSDNCIYTSLIYTALILIVLNFLIKERYEIKAIKLKSVTLNGQGITYYSGMQSRENWQVNWESIKCIKVK